MHGGTKVKAAIELDGIWHRVVAMQDLAMGGRMMWMGETLCGARPPDPMKVLLHDEFQPLTCMFCLGLD